MSKGALANLTVAQLREAAAAWRKAAGHGTEASLLDRIDELIDEVERLRGAKR